METVFITGATGFIGTAIIQRLIESGNKIRALVRPISQLRIKHPYIEKVTGDICDRKSFEDALKGVDKVYHLAGVVTDWAPRSLYEMTHINGTRNILEAAIIA